MHTLKRGREFWRVTALLPACYKEHTEHLLWEGGARATEQSTCEGDGIKIMFSREDIMTSGKAASVLATL